MAGSLQMNPGQEIKCPHCGRNSFLVKKSLMDGWTKLGDILACSSCSAKIEDVKTGQKAPCRKETVSKLASFLDTEEEAKPEIKSSEDERHFCRDCVHFISHPFMNRCELHRKNVEPMDDCPSFLRKQAKK